MRARGARLYLRIDPVEQTKHPSIAGPILARGAWWRLWCIGPTAAPHPVRPEGAGLELTASSARAVISGSRSLPSTALSSASEMRS
jgi:hypothetical protein